MSEYKEHRERGRLVVQLVESATCLGKKVGSATRRKCRTWFTTMRCFSFTLVPERSHTRSSHSRSKASSSVGAASFTTTDVSSSGTRSFKSSSAYHRSSHSEPSLDYRPGQDARPSGASAMWKADDLRSFTFSELRAATDDFFKANLLGEGGFGRVYKGAIQLSKYDGDSKMDVAVKQLNRKGLQGHKEWLAEVNVLGLVEHPQLVRLVGYCAEDDDRGMQRLLVYEFVANKSLEDHLFRRYTPCLSWTTRVKIALGAARGLAYLHEEMDNIQIIFRDFKASNVLLDADFNPKLSDFGLARQGPVTGDSHVSTTVVGTIGYAAPEYIQTGHLTCKSDVWSFGVVLLEMLTGRRAVDKNRPKPEQRLIEWIRPYMADNKRFFQIMDPRLEGNFSMRGALKLASLASQCLIKNPKMRPKMSDLVVGLEMVMELSTKDMPRPISFDSPPEGGGSSSLRRKTVSASPAPGPHGHGGHGEALSFFKDVLPLRSRDADVHMV